MGNYFVADKMFGVFTQIYNTFFPGAPFRWWETPLVNVDLCGNEVDLLRGIDDQHWVAPMQEFLRFLFKLKP